MNLQQLSKTCFLLLLLFIVVHVPFSLKAQVGLQLPASVYESERGILFNEFVLQPLLNIWANYDSNFFWEDSKEDPQTATYLLITPGLKIYNPNPNSISLSFTGKGNIRHYFTSDQAIKNQSILAGDANLNIIFFPKGKYNFKITGGFERSLQGALAATGANFNKNLFTGGAGIALTPGGGALKIMLDYGFSYSQFPDYDFGNLVSHNSRLLANWKFYPKTSIFIESNLSIYDYLNQTRSLEQISAQITSSNVNAMPFRTFLGLNGYITKKMSLNLKGGYGNSFHKEGSSFSNILGEASIAYNLQQNTLISLGYKRIFEPSYYANYYTSHQGFLQLQQRLFQRLNFNASVTYDYLNFSKFESTFPEIVDINQSERIDPSLTAKAKLDFNILRYLAVNIGYNFYSDFTDFAITNMKTNTTDYGSYKKHEIYGGISLLY